VYAADAKENMHGPVHRMSRKARFVKFGASCSSCSALMTFAKQAENCVDGIVEGKLGLKNLTLRNQILKKDPV